jgi:hypothetical protein
MFVTIQSRTIILPVVLYGYETLSLTLREKPGLNVFETRLLRIFGPKTDEDWRKLRIEECYNLYFSPKCNYNDLVKGDEMDRARSTNGREEECIGDIDGKTRTNEITRKTTKT